MCEQPVAMFFIHAVLLDIIPHRTLYKFKFAVIWFLSMVPVSDKICGNNPNPNPTIAHPTLTIINNN